MENWHRKHTRNHLDDGKEYTRFDTGSHSSGGWWILLVIFLIGAWIFIASDVDVTSVKTTIAEQTSDLGDKFSGFSNNKTDSLPSAESQCLEEFKQCASIREKKWGMNVYMNDYGTYNNQHDAEGFVNTWGTQGIFNSLETSPLSQYHRGGVYPLTLVAYSVDIMDNVKIPSIAVCSPEEGLTDLSKQALDC